VESPAKARTIAGFLGNEYVVESSVGHIRDLPSNAREVPEAYKRRWEVLAVDIDNDFKPLYIVNPDKKSKVKELKALLKQADELYLATDEDREGEAIAWHLLEVLNPPSSMPVKRMVFHEITPHAIEEAIESPRDLDRRLVDAQEARRLLDRIYGYGPLATVVRNKVGQGLSVGRVQSVATRLVVARERERMAFVAAGYWDLEGTFFKPADADRTFTAGLVAVDGKRVATGKDFGADGRPVEAKRGSEVAVLDESAARTLADELTDRPFEVRSVDRKPYRRRPAAPFITSTLQQEAGRKLRLSSSACMSAAQSLYENGYITYMRTDSTTLSDTALAAARSEITQRFGTDYLPDAPRVYTKKVKNAQEAHEAIRPAGDTFRSPDEVAREVNNPTVARVYDLIWKRTIASQMTDATGETVVVRLGATTATSNRDVEFSASGTVITHQGFRLAYVEDVDAGDEGDDDERERQLPPLAEGDPLGARDLEPQGHETQPPPRYTEASLVKRLEELGVGRPSTYASIMNTIQNRGYVWKKGTALVPSFSAFAVVNLLEAHFPNVVDYAFTARMEDDLDEIADGDEEPAPWLAEFYFGEPTEDGERHGGLREKVDEQLAAIDADAINSIPIGVDADGVAIVAKPGRNNSPYLRRGEDTASIPDGLAPDELTVDKALELLAMPKGGRELGEDPETGLVVLALNGRYGPYVQLGDFVDGSKEKPKRSSLFSTMSFDTLTLTEALDLLSLPRRVGVDPADDKEIFAANGRYGPYVYKNLEDGKTDSRSLDREDQLLTVTLDDTLKMFAEPKRRRGQSRPSALRELGIDPVSERPMVIKDGRFGPYVTDGETNASLRRGDQVDTITIERASELLSDRRMSGPAKKATKATAKKAASPRKSAAKKTAARSTSKKAVKQTTRRVVKGAAKKAAAKKATKKRA
jgi:DNA topoisomerase-1